MDILELDYIHGIPFDVDEEMARAWARMDETDNGEHDDED